MGAAFAGLPLAGWAASSAVTPTWSGEADVAAGPDGAESRLGLAWHRAQRAGTQHLGLQARVLQREAREPFADSRTEAAGVSVRQSLATGWGSLMLEAGSEQVRIDASAQARRQLPVHRYALGAARDLAPGWQLTARLSHEERAPREDELFANGPVSRAGVWIAGDPALGKGRANRAEAGLAWQRGANRADVIVFDSRRNHPHLQATGRQREPAPGQALAELAWRQGPARVRGIEARGRVRVRERRGVLDLELRGALLRGTQEPSGQPLPGLPPAQVGATLASEHGAWGGRVGFDHAARQRRVPAGQPPGPGNTVWGAALSYRGKAGPADLIWYARVENLGDRKASSAASLLAQAAAGRSAVQGRTLRVGLNATF